MPPNIRIGAGTRFSGLIFCYEKEKASLPLVIYLGKRSQITGQVYARGTVSLQDSLQVSGSITCQKFLYQSNMTTYENFLINTRISTKALSSYYLTSELLPAAGKKKKILQWLEGN